MNNLIIVVHIINNNNQSIEKRTLKQVQMVFDTGAYGVFLTIGDTGIDTKKLLSCYNFVRKHYTNKFIGINFMCNPSYAAQIVPNDVNALWIDKGLGHINYYNEINQVKKILTERKWNGKYFGGFCMKGNNQQLFENKEYFHNLTWKPEKYFDVCVSSGISTGIPIDNESFHIVKNKSNNMSLALASGINVDNIMNYINKVDYFIIGTGVEKKSTDIDIINFYKEAGLPNPVMIGYLDSKKIKQILNIINTSNR